ncbi:MAG: thiamine ABC transporter substrate-binding protein [Bifidobacteriaceae bacterium]|jgi:thiamine transport system substrate-binding protein|nr:thiamine ABC transporter substrate-binding protein [Bifidobacteriaceae bacterium]
MAVLLFPRTGRALRLAAAGFVAAFVLVGCAAGVDDDGPNASDASSPPSVSTGVVRLVTHDSFAVSDGIFEQFTAQTGYTVEVIPAGDAGQMVNQLILTKDNPIGDAVFGIDNTFASRALAEGILESLSESVLAPGAEPFAVEGGGDLAPVDYSDVCVNIDHEWFAERDLVEPVTLQDLARPEYKDLLVVENPATSSPGLSFLLATIGAFGEDGWRDYWADLVAGGVRAVDGWSDAYYVDFSGPSSEGDRPLVVSYASSPPAEVPQGAVEAPTAALLDTCFRQVEYAGVLAGSANQPAATALVEFLGTVPFQEDMPGSMWVYPVNPDAAIPEDWEAYAPLAAHPWQVSAEAIAANRERWIEEWAATVVG